MSFALLTPSRRAEILLPAGQVQSWEDDGVLSMGRWLVAVRISAGLFIAQQLPARAPMPPALLEQLVGYLAGRHNATVLRLHIPHRLHWHRQLPVTVDYWARRYLAHCKRHRLMPRLPLRHPSVRLPLLDGAPEMAEVWRELLLLADAVATHPPALMTKFRAALWSACWNWEQMWNVVMFLAANCKSLSKQEQTDARKADRAWADLVQKHLTPQGYQISPQAMCRLW